MTEIQICMSSYLTHYHHYKFLAVIECTRFPVNETKERIYRARFSSVTEKDILKAMDNLVEPNRHEALAVEARQEIDLKVGVAFTRFQTSYFQGKYGNLDSRVISLVLSPLLAFFSSLCIFFLGFFICLIILCSQRSLCVSVLICLYQSRGLHCSSSKLIIALYFSPIYFDNLGSVWMDI